MKHALTVNIGIILVILVGLIATRNPLFVLGLLMLQEMPFGLLTQRSGQDDGGQDAPQPMGFTQDVR